MRRSVRGRNEWNPNVLWSIISTEQIKYVHDRIPKNIIKEDFYVVDFLFLYLDESSLFPRNKNQLSSLIIHVTKSQGQRPVEDMNVLLFTSIFARCTNLQYLNFGSSISWYICLSFVNSPPTCISSNLLELHLRLGNFLDCLYILDGRFSHLHTFHVDIRNMQLIYNNVHSIYRSNINNKVEEYFDQHFECTSLYYLYRKNCRI